VAAPVLAGVLAPACRQDASGADRLAVHP